MSILVLLTALLAAPADDAFAQAEAAFKKQDYKAAKEFALQAVKLDPTKEEPRLLLGMACQHLRDNSGAVAAFREVVRLNPKSIFAHDRLGDAQLKLGRFAEAVASFDQVLALKPDYAPEHWRRGIALYYAGKYADGAKQFETHKTANPQDVENAAWHYMCNAKVIGKAKAQAELIVVTQDRRVPMAEIQKLFAGKLSPADVMAVAEKLSAESEDGKQARFYANLYIALWYEAEGNEKKVLDHLTPAVEQFVISHYMWDVANAHLAWLKTKPKAK